MFNPVIKEADIHCKRFTPKDERSIFCRTCDRRYFDHSPESRKFDSVFEMHRAYMTDNEVIKWLWSIGDTLEKQIDVVQEILDTGVEVVNAPDQRALQAVKSCLDQMLIEQRLMDAEEAKLKRRCVMCKQFIEREAHKVCAQCAELIADGDRSGDTEGGSEVQIPLPTPAHDSKVPHDPDLSRHAFD